VCVWGGYIETCFSKLGCENGREVDGNAGSDFTWQALVVLVCSM